MLTSKVDRSDGTVDELVFDKNPNWWGAHGDVETIRVKRYDTSEEVKSALLNGKLDMVVGGGVLTPTDVKEFQTQHLTNFETKLGPALGNQIIVQNAAKSPTNDIEVRKLIQHAVDKARIVDTEMAGMEQVADSLFPKSRPYCDIDLTPRWDYDFQKAHLMNCSPSPDEDHANTALILGLVLGIGIPCLALAAGAFIYGRRRGYQDLEAQLLDWRWSGWGPALCY